MDMKKTNMESFVEYVQKNGPLPASDIDKIFKKHNELFLRAHSRGLGIRRYVVSAPRKLGKMATWYYAPGQEAALKERVISLVKGLKNLS